MGGKIYVAGMDADEYKALLNKVKLYSTATGITKFRMYLVLKIGSIWLVMVNYTVLKPALLLFKLLLGSKKLRLIEDNALEKMFEIQEEMSKALAGESDFEFTLSDGDDLDELDELDGLNTTKRKKDDLLH